MVDFVRGGRNFIRVLVWVGWITALWLALPANVLALEPSLVLKDGRPFCEAYPCKRLLPEAEAFRRAELPVPVLEATQGGEVIAYLFLSTDLVSIPAYSGKPLVTLIAMDPQGLIIAATVVHHNEPILLVGIPEEVLDEYLDRYKGRSILKTGLLDLSPAEAKEELKRVGKGHAPPNVYMITGATVTALVLDETLLASSRAVARALGLLALEGRRIISWKGDYSPRNWQALVEEGMVGHLRVEAEEMGESSPNGEPWIDLYFGDLTQPVFGINILGESTYNWLVDNLAEGEKAIFIAGNGMSSFKGSGFVRGGIFDRFYLKQGLNKFTFKDLDYEHLYSIAAEGAPPFKETGLFFLRNSRFDSTLPWDFVFLSGKLTGETATSKIFKTFTAPYTLPERYFSVRVEEPPRKRSIVERVWSDQWPEVVGLSLFLLGVMGVFFMRSWLRTSAHRLEVVHISVMVISVVYVGAVLKTPPSITQLFPLLQSFELGFRLSLFLSDPLVFIFWIAIAVSLLLWGRGWFCGWVCPYGSLLELVHRLSSKILPKKFTGQLPLRIHDRLRWLRYVILFGLVGLSIFSIEWAEILAEVEPFKTTWIVGVFNREWYLVLYWWVLLGVSVFIFRFFCRYLCPLGAALSIGTAFRLIGIKRKEFCTRCNICANGCDSMAINPNGDIDKYECLYCMECEQKYHDDQICPPLVIARRASERHLREAGTTAGEEA